MTASWLIPIAGALRVWGAMAGLIGLADTRRWFMLWQFGDRRGEVFIGPLIVFRAWQVLEG